MSGAQRESLIAGQLRALGFTVDWRLGRDGAMATYRHNGTYITISHATIDQVYEHALKIHGAFQQ